MAEDSGLIVPVGESTAIAPSSRSRRTTGRSSTATWPRSGNPDLSADERLLVDRIATASDALRRAADEEALRAAETPEAAALDTYRA